MPCSPAKSSRNVFLYISGGAALVKTLLYGYMKYRALEEPSEITGVKAMLHSLIEEYRDFRILCILNENPKQ